MYWLLRAELFREDDFDVETSTDEDIGDKRQSNAEKDNDHSGHAAAGRERALLLLEA